MQRQDLERMSREQLIAEAEQLGVPRPRVLTQAELVDEILGKTAKTAGERARVRGWLGRARDLLARVVERGLHLPEAARALRRESEEKGWPAPPPPMPTVTLAEIYAAQGHLERALGVLDEVLAREPEHKEALAMRARFVEQLERTRGRSGRDQEAPPSTQPAPVVEKKEPPPTEAPTSAAADAASIDAAPTTQASPSMPPPAADEAGATDEASAKVSEASHDGDSAPVPARRPATDVEAELPERYEVDEVVAIAVDPRTIYLYWEVRATTLARARARQPDGFLCVRVATVIASWEGPLVDTMDLRVDALYGDRFVSALRPGSNVRVTVGWRAGDSFEPFAIGAEVTAPRVAPVAPVAQEIARWEAEPSVAAFQRRGEAGAPAAGYARSRDPELGVVSAPKPPAHARATSWVRAAGRPSGAALDTGVAIWGGQGADQERDGGDEDAQPEEASWFEPGGSSELGRPRRVERVRVSGRSPRPVLMGASELSR